MARIIGILGLISGVIGIILMLFATIFTFIADMDLLTNLGIGFGIAAIAIGVVHLLAPDPEKGFGAAAIILGILTVFFWWLIVFVF